MKREFESKFKLSIYILSFLFTFIYIVYRIFFTIPSDSVITIVIAIMVLVLEILDAFFYGVYVFNVLIYKKKNILAPEIKEMKYPDVDVFIATYNEDVELLRNTIIACKNMKYPNKNKVHIYLCDDGHRDEMKALTQELKVNYITRDDNKDAKSGNYNNAIKHTKSPYIATFDADMKPEEDFLLKTIPFFMKDSKVGFVQLPQCFHEPDFFQAKFKILNEIPFEQTYFYHNIQMAKNQTNSVIYCGTNTVLSRKALNDVGGYATKTITEDIATGMLIESSGYKGIAINDDLVYGEVVKSTDSMLKQRARWCRGCIQTFKHYIIKNKSLTIKQRLDYVSAIYYWSFGVRTIFYLLVPLLFSVFDKRIIQGQVYLFLILFFIQFILKRFIIDHLEEHKVSSTWNRVYETILAPIISFESLKEAFGFGNLKFDVTSKNNAKKKGSFRVIYLYLSHLFLFICTITGLIFSVYKGLLLGFKDYIVPFFWLISNMFYLGIALIFDCSVYQREYENPHNDSTKYKSNSVFKVIYNYFRYEFRTKEIIALLSCILLLFGFIKSDLSNVIRINRNSVSYNLNLQIKNGNLVNQRGETVSLRGVSTHNLYWFGDQYTKKNIKTLVNTWGINVFRVALYTDPDEEGYLKNKEVKEKLEDIVQSCIDLNIYVIIDWHILNDNDPNDHVEEALKFFDEMSLKYKDVPNVIYEICNEPNGEDVTWEKIRAYADRIVYKIRENDDNSIILVGTPNWSKDISVTIHNHIPDNNVMYVIHYYPGDDIKKIREDMVNAMVEDIPIFVTETALTDATGDGDLHEDEFREWIQFLESNHISWVVWQFSDKEEASSLVLSYDKKKSFNDSLTESGKVVKELMLEYSNQTK